MMPEEGLIPRTAAETSGCDVNTNTLALVTDKLFSTSKNQQYQTCRRQL